MFYSIITDKYVQTIQWSRKCQYVLICGHTASNFYTFNKLYNDYVKWKRSLSRGYGRMYVFLYVLNNEWV